VKSRTFIIVGNLRLPVIVHFEGINQLFTIHLNSPSLSYSLTGNPLPHTEYYRTEPDLTYCGLVLQTGLQRPVVLCLVNSRIKQIYQSNHPPVDVVNRRRV
jgi:hypothetical protein